MTYHEPETAFADPATVRAWQRERRRSLTTMTFWALFLVVWVGLSTVVSGWSGTVVASIVAVPGILVAVVGMALGSLRREHLGKMRAVLAAYPWQHCPALGEAHPAGIEYFRLPDPDEPQKHIHVAFRRYGTGKRWRRAVAEARSAGFAFAGDPRYAGVVALPGLRELLAVRPQHVYIEADGTRPRTVSEEAWRRAEEAGITTAPSAEEQRRNVLYSLRRAAQRRASS
jgi:hypothetical protein